MRDGDAGRPVGRLVLRVAAMGALVLGALPLGTAAALAQDAAVSDKTLELEFWRSVSTSTDPAMYDAYLQQFPNGTFAPLAKVKAAALRRGATSSPAAAPPPPPAPAIPAPVAVPVAAAPAPVTPPPAAAPTAAVAATAQAGPNETAAASLLASLAAAQETPAAPAAAVSAAAQAAAPAPQDITAGRPHLETVPAVVLPARFCSAEERNAFHAQTYRPAGEAAEANNGKAIAYLQSIQARYDAMAAGDADMRNALAKEARDYKPIADAAFQAQQALVRQFDALMAVPITSCGVAK
ncbi:UNVERIFIED_ORG: hypothetical protein M2348_003242 [Sphingomonas sp. R1F5B]